MCSLGGGGGGGGGGGSGEGDKSSCGDSLGTQHPPCVLKRQWSAKDTVNNEEAKIS